MYTYKSTSDEGIFFLTKNWEKCETFWFSDKFVQRNLDLSRKYFYTTPRAAKANLTRLLKIMPEYRDDVFELVEM